MSVTGWSATGGRIRERARERAHERAHDPAGGRDQRTDQLAPFRPLITAIRWGTLAVGFVVAEFTHPTLLNLLLGLVLGTYALARSFRPLTYRAQHRRDLLAVSFEVVLTASVVVATGNWSSPYFFCLITAVVATAFTSGSTFSICTASAAALAVALPYHLGADAELKLTVLGTSELLLVAMVSGYARRMFGEAEARASRALDRVTRLSEANQLLHELHRVAQTLPASLDLSEVVSSSALRLEELFAPEVVAVLLCDGGVWTVASAKGMRLPATMAGHQLPSPLRAAGSGHRTIRMGAASAGLSPQSRSGMYAPLRARGALVGLLAVESTTTDRYSDRDADLLAALAEQVALAVDNARWFARLRTVGAEEERTRIARDLHDRLGQSLAYLAFELDRISANAAGTPIHADVAALRQDVRRVVGEMRDTLYDLRTDVSETQNLVSTVETFLRRVQERTGIGIRLDADGRRRLPLPQERELWRIAQEAVTNAERHARGTTIEVTWRCDGDGAFLEVADNGVGLPGGEARLDAYGMLGMRERADAIGAALDVVARPGGGTVVRCRLGVS